MKRATLMALSLAGIAACFSQAGCVSQDEFRKLQRAEADCNSQRERLIADLKAAQGQIDALNRDKSLAAADKENLRVGLMAQLEKLNAQYQSLVDERNDLIAKLEKQQPVAVFTGPMLAPEVDAALKKFATDNPGLIEYDEKAGLVRFKSDLLFESGSFDIKPDVLKQLRDFAEVINIPAAQVYDVLVVGHTDAQPISKPATRAKTPTNWHLSVFRAVSVVEALTADRVDTKRLGAMGFGEFHPRVASGPKGNTPENRRVEIYLVPKGSLATTPGVMPAVPKGSGAPPAPAPSPAPRPGGLGAGTSK